MVSSNLIRRLQASPVARLTTYFVLLGVGIALAVWYFPELADAFHAETRGQIDQLPADLQPVGVVRDELPPFIQQVSVALLLLGGSLLFVTPIVRIYMVTKRQEGYDKTFVQVLFMLPVVVAAVVQIVRGDLALAFALAGIVAAIRFRTTLRDLKNAVFAFAAIGIGLAAGTGSWTLAGVLSLVFSATAYTLWKGEIGGLEGTFSLPTGSMRLSEALVPGESQRSVVVGSERLTSILSPVELTFMTEHAAKMVRYIRADALKSKQKYDTLLLIYTSDSEVARPAAAKLLDKYTKRWHLVDQFPGPEDATVLEYLIRLKKDAEVGEFLDRLSCADESPLRAAELKPIKGLRDKMS